MGWLKGFGMLGLLLGAGAIALPAQDEQPSTNPVKFTTLVNFDLANGANVDVKPLIQGLDGNIYGTTGSGGANNAGTAFKMTPDGTLTTLYNFCALSGCGDGNGPGPGVRLGTDGEYYGVTDGGGVVGLGFGTVFRITAAGGLKTLHSFVGTDGAYPNSFLVQGTDGSFYGTTIAGGNLAACSGSGCGTVFKVTPGGALTMLYKFCSQPNCTDGAVAFDGLVQGTDGNFYGATWQGGAYNLGTIYKMTPAGALSVIYSFCSQSACTDGANPLWVVPGKDGKFYGTTYNGGANNVGTVFKISPAGKLTTLHSFDGADGANPIGSLGQDTNGSFYGTTGFGGTSSACTGGCGTVFRVSVGLGPFVETVPTSGKVGTPVKILGTNLTGASSVRFNETPAVFKVISKTLISATVPAGASTGFVTVTTSGETLKSNVKFQVRP